MKSTQTRIWVKTLQKLRKLYGNTGEKMVAILDRLVTAELTKNSKKEDTQEPE